MAAFPSTSGWPGGTINASSVQYEIIFAKFLRFEAASAHSASRFSRLACSAAGSNDGREQPINAAPTKSRKKTRVLHRATRLRFHLFASAHPRSHVCHPATGSLGGHARIVLLALPFGNNRDCEFYTRCCALFPRVVTMFRLGDDALESAKIFRNPDGLFSFGSAVQLDPRT